MPIFYGLFKHIYRTKTALLWQLFHKKKQTKTWWSRNFKTSRTPTASKNRRTDMIYTPGLFTSNMCTALQKKKKTTTVRRAALPTVDQSYCTCSPFKPIAEGQCSERSQSLWARTTDATEMQQTEQNNKLHCKSNSFTPKQYEAKGEITMVKASKKKKKKIRPPMHIRVAFWTDKAFREHHFFLKGAVYDVEIRKWRHAPSLKHKDFQHKQRLRTNVARFSILKDVLAYNGISLDCSSSIVCFWDG